MGVGLKKQKTNKHNLYYIGAKKSLLARATVGTSLYVSLRVSLSVRFCFLCTSHDVVRHRTV